MVLQQTPLTHNFSQDPKNLPKQVSFVLSKIYSDFRNGATLYSYSDVAGIANVSKEDFEETQLRQYRDVNLSYDNPSGTFTVGLTVSGASATGVIVADTGSVLTLKDITGIFVDNESITDGTATADADGIIDKYLVTKLDDTLYKTQWTAL